VVIGYAVEWASVVKARIELRMGLAWAHVARWIEFGLMQAETWVRLVASKAQDNAAMVTAVLLLACA
jgi:hypothetical protein